MRNVFSEGFPWPSQECFKKAEERFDKELYAGVSHLSIHSAQAFRVIAGALLDRGSPGHRKFQAFMRAVFHACHPASQLCLVEEKVYEKRGTISVPQMVGYPCNKGSNAVPRTSETPRRPGRMTLRICSAATFTLAIIPRLWKRFRQS